jgi:hypothetical protein
MAMPRPSGIAQKIAEKVIPGLQRNSGQKSKKTHQSLNDYGELSEVEVMQTNNIENKSRLKNERPKAKI